MSSRGARARSGLARGVWLVALALVASACAPLDLVKVGECGNGFVEPGEDCDGTGSCGAPGSTFECRYLCTTDAEGESSCPSGFVCGGDGLCRKPTGRLVLTDSISSGYDGLQLADLDGDERIDVVGISESLGVLEAHFLLDASIAQTTTIAWAERAVEVPLGDFTGDGYADVVAPVSGTFGLILGSYDRSFTPLLETFPAKTDTATMVDVRLMSPVQRGLGVVIDPESPPGLLDTELVVAHLEGSGHKVLVDYAENAVKGAQIGLSDTVSILDFAQSSGPTLDHMVLGNFDALRPGLELVYTVPGTSIVGVARTRTLGDAPIFLDEAPVESPVLPGEAQGRAAQATFSFFSALTGESLTLPGLVTFVSAATGGNQVCFVHRALGLELLEGSCAPLLPGVDGELLATVDLVQGNLTASLTSKHVPDLVTTAGVYGCSAPTDYPGAGPKSAPTTCSATPFLTFDTPPREVLVEDLDGDGLADLVASFDGGLTNGGPTTGFGKQPELRIYFADGDGGVTEQSVLLERADPTGLAVGDLDGDQRLDLVVTTDAGVDETGDGLSDRRNVEIAFGAGFGAFEPAAVHGSLTLPWHKRTIVHELFGLDLGVDDLVLFGHAEHGGGDTLYSPVVGSAERLYITPFATQEDALPLLGLAANVLEPTADRPERVPGALDLVALEARREPDGDVVVVTMRSTLEDAVGVHPSVESEVELTLEGTFRDSLGGYASLLGGTRAQPRGLVLPRPDGLDELVLFVPDRCANLEAAQCASPSASSPSTRIYWGDPTSASSPVPYLAGPPDAGDYSVLGAVRDAAVFDVDDDGVLDVVFLVERSDGAGPSHELWIVRRTEGQPFTLEGAELYDVSPGKFSTDDDPFFGEPSSIGVLDIDGDGVAEVLVNGEPAAHTYDTLLVRRALGEEAATVSRYPWVRWGASSMKTADLTGDGLADLIVTYAGSSGLTTNSFTQIYVANVESAGSGDL